MEPDYNPAGEIFTVATCASNLSGGAVKLLLPGETTASAKYYKVLNNVGITNGARVICVRMSGTWVVLGSFNAGGGGGGGGDYVSYGESQSLTSTQKATARSNIGAGTGSYSKPSGGIPKTDLATAVQNALIPAGGTTGQVLAKTSGSDYAVGWTNQSGGLPAVTASDNGKILQVVNGAWAAASLPSANGVSF